MRSRTLRIHQQLCTNIYYLKNEVNIELPISQRLKANGCVWLCLGFLDSITLNNNLALDSANDYMVVNIVFS